MDLYLAIIYPMVICILNELLCVFFLTLDSLAYPWLTPVLLFITFIWIDINDKVKSNNKLI